MPLAQIYIYKTPLKLSKPAAFWVTQIWINVIEAERWAGFAFLASLKPGWVLDLDLSRIFSVQLGCHHKGGLPSLCRSRLGGGGKDTHALEQSFECELLKNWLNQKASSPRQYSSTAHLNILSPWISHLIPEFIPSNWTERSEVLANYFGSQTVPASPLEWGCAWTEKISD